jgi:hypothetical protein
MPTRLHSHSSGIYAEGQRDGQHLPLEPGRELKEAAGQRYSIYRQSRGKTSTQNLGEDKNMEETGPVEQVKR